MKNFSFLDEAKTALKTISVIFGILLAVIMIVVTADNNMRINGLEKVVFQENIFKLEKNETQKMSPKFSNQLQKGDLKNGR